MSTDKLAELQESLSEYCGQVTPRSDFYPTIGDVCCAQFSGEDMFYMQLSKIKIFDSHQMAALRLEC